MTQLCLQVLAVSELGVTVAVDESGNLRTRLTQRAIGWGKALIIGQVAGIEHGVDFHISHAVYPTEYC